jgi:hypothetical protein
MAQLQQQFDSYLIYYRSLPDGVPGTRVIVNCWKANTYVGALQFALDGTPLPANTGSASSIQLNFPLSRFNDLITILRYESPLYLYLSTDSLVGIVSTAAEPIGEEEPK